MARQVQRAPWIKLLAVFAAAITLLWPALLNRYPFVMPDSITYVLTGPQILHELAHPWKEADIWRSELFCVSLTALHWGRSYWPIVIADALGTAWMLWLVVRCLVPRRALSVFAVLIVVLSAFTSLPWVVSTVSADVYGPFVYLAIVLLVMYRERLTRTETIALMCFVPWGVCSHMTHGMIAAAVLLLLAAFWLLRITWMRSSGRSLLQVLALLAVAALAQIASHAFLYGKPSLSGQSSAFLTARLLGDGTGYKYLHTHCNTLSWRLCRDLARVPEDDRQFLWSPDGLWLNYTPAIRSEVRAEEGPFVRATVAAYPMEQMRRSARNAWQQLWTFDLCFLTPAPSVITRTEEAVTGSRAGYLHSRQASDANPIARWGALQRAFAKASMLLLLPVLFLAWRRGATRFLGVAAVCVWVLVVNAVVTGVLSAVDCRYGARVIWMVTFLLLLGIATLMTERREAKIA